MQTTMTIRHPDDPTKRIELYRPERYYTQRPDLSDVLIICASYQGLEWPVHAFVRVLQECGAAFLPSIGASDPALHRNLVAGRALQLLAKEPALKWILWIDDDNYGTPAHVEWLRQTAKQLLDADGQGPAIAAHYCKRGKNSSLTQRRQHEEPTITVRLPILNGAPSAASQPVMVDGDKMSTVVQELIPSVGGLGLVIVPAATFQKHCRESINISFAAKGENTDELVEATPCICASGPVQDETGAWGWASEDMVYCEGLWTFCRGFYVAPIVVPHMSNVPLLPLPDAAWLAQQEPSAVSQSLGVNAVAKALQSD